MIERRCFFSPDRVHRYTLWRDADIFGDKDFVQFIGMNPSTADEVQDDPTITRCINFATRWGYKELCMTNMFAFRATDPNDMKKAADPVGPENMDWLLRIAATAPLIVCAWGVDGAFNNQAKAFLAEAGLRDLKLHCLDITRDGHPKHPLYIAATATPRPFNF